MPDLTVATTILEQLGGRRFIVMTGAKNFVGGATDLAFRVPRSKDGANAVRVTLTPMDLYTVETYSVRRNKDGILKHTPKSSVDGVYGDTLAGVFTSLTGLDTRL